MRIHSDKGLKLEASVFNLLRWLIYLIDLGVDNLFSLLWLFLSPLSIIKVGVLWNLAGFVQFIESTAVAEVLDKDGDGSIQVG